MSDERRVVTAFAPAGVGNVAVGFDILGHTLQGPGDRVTVRRTDEPGVRITRITGLQEAIPMEPARNTATAGLLALRRDLDLPFGFEVGIEKGIPLGSGMGGSAASAVAAIVAASALLPAPLDVAGMFRYALIGEAVAAGSAHGDNIAAGLLGGLTLLRASDPPDLVPIPVPAGIRCVLVRPGLRLDTRVARKVLRAEVPLEAHSRQAANLAGLIAGCHTGDLELIGRSLVDVLVEPRRERLVPGFRRVKAAALDAGALGGSISGAGPSVFAWCPDEAVAAVAREAMVSAFAETGLDAEGWISPVDGPGARLVEAA
jgi:homoserine kinase